MKKIGLLALVALGSATTALAQSPEELLRFSRTDYSLTTARSAAMGGAFTSLGADPISLSLNPAGLGMYSRNETTITGALRITNSKAHYGAQGPVQQNNYTKPIINNFAFVFTNNNSGWHWGFGMNRLADFSGRYQVSGNYGTESMAYVLRDQLQGVPAGDLDPDNYPFMSHAPASWNAIMAYNTWLVNPDTEHPNNTDYWVSPSIMSGDKMASQLSMVTNGAIDEFALSAAYDMNGILYFGATLGMQNIFYRQNSYYEEFAHRDNLGSLNEFGLGENLAIDGFGVNLKVGITVRPVSWLRFGVAYHSPTWITSREVSTRNMETWGNWGENFAKNHYDFSADLVQEYDNQTPSRLLAGISATIARRVIVSVDYEAAWYDGMCYSTSMNWSSWRSPVAPNDVDNNPVVVGNYTNSRNQIDVNGMIRDSYRQTNTLRVGVEAQPLNGVFLRAGYSYSDSPYASKDSFYASGSKLSNFGATTQWSGGLGYRQDAWGFDLAYINSSRKDLPSVFYDHVATSDYSDIRAGDQLMPFDNNYVSWVSHNILLTFSWRF